MIFLEALYLRKDLLAVLLTGYGKSLAFSRFSAIVEGKGYNTHFSKFNL